MAVTIKSPREIELMREAGRILAKTHEELAKNLRPGMSTWDIDHMGEEIIRSYGCIPSFKNYNGYPASICVSVNDEVVHGIPHKEHFLDEGDIVSLDAGVIYKGYHSDAARTYGIGEIDDDAKKLIEVTRQSFFDGIKLPKLAIISMTSLQRSRNMPKVSVLVLSGIWLVMESVPICMRIRRFRILQEKEKESSYSPA